MICSIGVKVSRFFNTQCPGISPGLTLHRELCSELALLALFMKMSTTSISQASVLEEPGHFTEHLAEAAQESFIPRANGNRLVPAPSMSFLPRKIQTNTEWEQCG
jgi:hypothetical protein